MLDLPLEDYTLTFDDGLYSQYSYLDYFKNLGTEKIFFISTGLIHPGGKPQSDAFPRAQEAHEAYFKNRDTSNYMNWNQIKEIHSTPHCHVGGHSHGHLKHDGLSIKDLYVALTEDTQNMMDSFKENGLQISHFCYPYNIQHPLYESILRENNLKHLYGRERVAIETLMGS